MSASNGKAGSSCCFSVVKMLQPDLLNVISLLGRTPCCAASAEFEPIDGDWRRGCKQCLSELDTGVQLPTILFLQSLRMNKQPTAELKICLGQQFNTLSAKRHTLLVPLSDSTIAQCPIVLPNFCQQCRFTQSPKSQYFPARISQKVLSIKPVSSAQKFAHGGLASNCSPVI